MDDMLGCSYVMDNTDDSYLAAHRETLSLSEDDLEKLLWEYETIANEQLPDLHLVSVALTAIGSHVSWSLSPPPPPVGCFYHSRLQGFPLLCPWIINYQHLANGFPRLSSLERETYSTGWQTNHSCLGHWLSYKTWNPWSLCVLQTAWKTTLSRQYGCNKIPLRSTSKHGKGPSSFSNGYSTWNRAQGTSGIGTQHIQHNNPGLSTTANSRYQKRSSSWETLNSEKATACSSWRT